jgi:hypothetical protein
LAVLRVIELDGPRECGKGAPGARAEGGELVVYANGSTSAPMTTIRLCMTS